jgi:anti-sigma-K factor RskA
LLVVSPTRKGVLVANSLPEAGRGKTYEAWVVQGTRARPAGLFRGGAGSKVVELTKPVAPGAIVGVTLERAGGSKTPTGAMLLRASA